MEKERLKKERAMEAAQQQRGGVVVKTSQTPPVDLDAVSGTRDFFQRTIDCNRGCFLNLPVWLPIQGSKSTTRQCSTTRTV